MYSFFIRYRTWSHREQQMNIACLARVVLLQVTTRVVDTELDRLDANFVLSE